MQVGKRLAAMIALVVVFSFSSTSYASAPQDPLWQKAVGKADMGRRWFPGKVMMREEKLDGKGATTSSSEHWMEARELEDGDVTYETFKILENGKDVTQREKASEQEEAEKAKAKSKAESQDKGKEDSPSVSYTFSAPDIFDSEGQARVSVKALGQRKVVGGRQCVGYEFATERDQKTYREKLRGVAWLDEQTGIPVELKYTATPLPKHVKSAQTVVHYQDTPDGSFCPAEIITEGTAGFLFIKANFRMTLKFLEYRKRQEK